MNLPNIVRIAGLLIAVAAGAPCAPAAVIYQDSLTGAGTELNGTLVDVSTGFAGGTLNATWLAAAGVVETDSGATYGAGNAAFLPIAVEGGHIYRLTATVEKTFPSEYVSLGFAKGPLKLDGTIVDSSAFAWVACYHAGKEPLAFGGANFGGKKSGWPNNPGRPEVILIELDTTAAQWTVTFTIQGISKTHTFAAADSVPGNFQYIGFATNRTEGNLVRNLLLTAQNLTTNN